MSEVQFYRPVREEPDFKDSATLEEALRAKEEWSTQLERDTLWECGTGWLNGGRGCGDLTAVGETTLIQTHFYIPPSGCTGGDYWLPGEWRLRCECGFESRYSETNHLKGYDYSKNRYHKNALPVSKLAFKEVIDEHND